MNPIEWILNSAISSFFALLPQTRPALEKLKAVKIVAHRGVHENNLARENSMESFRLALENNIWAIELDIHFTKDNIAVINHDPNCKRLFGRADITIDKINFAELRKQLPQIATLNEVVQEFGQKLHLMIEVKTDLSREPLKVAALQKTLAPLQPVTNYHLLTLKPEYLEPLSFAPKAALLDVIWLSPKEIIRRNANLNHGAIAGHFLFFGPLELKTLKAQGKRVGVGFLDSKNSLFREINRGADYIFTNHPLRLKKYLLDPA